MNKTSKIFLVIIFILVIALVGMTYRYLEMRNAAKNNLSLFLDQAELLSKANEKLSEFQNKIGNQNLASVTNRTEPYIPEGMPVADPNDNSGIPAEDIEFDRSPENVTIEVLKDTVTDESLQILITDNNKDSYGWGVAFGIQKKVNNEWKDLEYVSDDLAWISIAYALDENNQLKQKLDIEEYYGKLEAGVYRVVKPVYDKEYIDLYSDEFEIK